MAVSASRLRFALSEDIVVAARRAMEKAKRDVISNLASHRDTGKMERSVKYRVRPNVASVTVTLKVEDPGASFLDLGTQGPITSTRPGGRLAVFARSGGPVVFAQAVRGQPATHFFTSVAEELVERVGREFGLK